MTMKTLPLAKVYQLIEPGPVALVTTARKGRANVMTMSWHMMVEFEPPMIACVLSEANYSFAALAATGECVIALPARRLAARVVKVGNSSGRDIDKFARFGLTPLEAARVKAPLIAECFANLECRVVDRRLVKAYNLFILEVVKAWIDPRQKNPKTIHHHGYGRFVADGRAFTLKSRMR
jgi:flavin reductase (DIM6/NTAB) family NADH-FMN oxidoreductase RutF